MSVLKVNFCKSNVYDINLSDMMLALTSSFLACGIKTLPFKFLGVMVGDSPRKVAMCKKVVRNVRRRLDMWSRRFLSLGGRVVLINSILNYIPLYSLSFYRAPKKVIKDIRSIQMRFLWRGVKGKMCVH